MQVKLIHQNLRIMEEVLKRLLRKQRRLQFRSEMMTTIKFSRRGKKQLKLDKKALKHLAKLENEIVMNTPRKKVRSSGSETIAYFRQKSEVDADLKKEELRLKALEEQRIRENAEQQQKMLTDVLTQ